MKRKVILYMGISLDGYIADSNGGVEWLDAYSNDIPSQEFQDFYDSIDTVLLGYDTYRQIVEELSPKQWPYENKLTFVFTSKNLDSTNNIKFINEPIDEYIKELKLKEGKNIWLCGGAAVSNALIRAGLVDTFNLTIMPVILGEGIRLFDQQNPKMDLKMIHLEKYDNVIQVVYE